METVKQWKLSTTFVCLEIASRLLPMLQVALRCASSSPAMNYIKHKKLQSYKSTKLQTLQDTGIARIATINRKEEDKEN